MRRNEAVEIHKIVPEGKIPFEVFCCVFKRAAFNRSLDDLVREQIPAFSPLVSQTRTIARRFKVLSPAQFSSHLSSFFSSLASPPSSLLASSRQTRPSYAFIKMQVPPYPSAVTLKPSLSATIIVNAYFGIWKTLF